MSHTPESPAVATGGAGILARVLTRVLNEPQRADGQFESHDSHSEHSSSDPTVPVTPHSPIELATSGARILERVAVRLQGEAARAAAGDHSSHTDHSDFNAHVQQA